MPAVVNLTGQRFGRLVARTPTDERRSGSVVWLCDCDCGAKDVPKAAHDLRLFAKGRGGTGSCGCVMREVATALATAMHGPARRVVCGTCRKRFSTRQPNTKYCGRKCWPSAKRPQ